jgi:hypothetical protein
VVALVVRRRIRGRRRRGPIVALALALPIAAAGCRASAPDASPPGTPADTGGALAASNAAPLDAPTMLNLLELIPADGVPPNDGIHLANLRRARDVWSITPPLDADPVAAVDTSRDHLEQAPAGVPLDPMLYQCQRCESPASAGAARAALLAENGFDPSDLTASIDTERLTILTGRFDPAVVLGSLASDPSSRSTGGDRESGAQVVDVDCGQSHPAAHLSSVCAGLPAPHIFVAATSQLYVRAATAELARATLARAAGVGPSAADDPTYRAIATAADASAMYVTWLLEPRSTPCSPTGPTSTVAGCVPGRPDRPGTRQAIGLARAGDRPNPTVLHLLANADPAVLTDAGQDIVIWYTQARAAVSGEPFATIYDTPVVSSVGSVVVVTVPLRPSFDEHQFWADEAKSDFPRL